MPGFDILQQPFQYHAPVAPEVPTPDNTAAKIISAGTDTAVGAFIKMAVARKQAQLEEEQQAQTAALTLRAQDIARENNMLDYKVGLANAASLEKYRTGTGGIYDPRTRAQMAFNWRLQQKQIEDDRAQSVQTVDQQAIPEAHDMGLNNEENWVKNPVGTLDKFMNWSGRWGNSVDGQVPKELARYKTRAELLKANIRVGATFKDGYYKKPEGAASGQKPVYVPAQWIGGSQQQVPLLDLVQRYRYHPELRDQIRQELMAAGATLIFSTGLTRLYPQTTTRKVIKGTNITVPFTSPQVIDPGKPETTVHQIQMNQDVEDKLKAAEHGTFLKGESQVPPALTAPLNKAINPYEDAGGEVLPDQGGAAPAGTTIPEPDLPPLAPGSSIESPSGTSAPRYNYQPTKADTVLQQARRALAANPAAEGEIRRRLASMYINPDLLQA